MPSFVDIATLTRLSSITGNEEFQVSATNKISSRDIASLALTQQLHGFSEVTTGLPKISSTSLLQSAIAALYRLSSDNGKVLPISDGIDKFGNVVFSGPNAVGILFDVRASKYFTRSGTTATTVFHSAEWISWLQGGEAHEMDGGAVDPIYIGANESITMIVENHSWNKDGEIVPVFIEPSSDIYDQLPQIKNASFPQAESTIVGYAQRVYDGGDYQHIGLTLTIWETSGRIAYRGEVLMNNSGDVMETMLTPIGTFASPIPGFTKIANEYDLALSTGSLMIVSFNYEVINSTAMFIDAELRSSAGPNGVIRSVAIPVTFFNPVQAATLMDLNTRSIASGTNIGQIRLNVASIVTGAKGIQGLQVIVTSNNLSEPSDILRIKGVYANI